MDSGPDLGGQMCSSAVTNSTPTPFGMLGIPAAVAQPLSRPRLKRDHSLNSPLGFTPRGAASSEEPLPPAVARPRHQGIVGGHVVDARVPQWEAHEHLDERRVEDGRPSPTAPMLARRLDVAGTPLPDLVGQGGARVRSRVGPGGVPGRVARIGGAWCRPPTSQPFQPRCPSAGTRRIGPVLRRPVRDGGRCRPE